MNAEKRQRLEAAGWQVGTSEEFLDLSPVEASLVEIRLALSRAIRTRREESGVSQTALARLAGSSQSRIAKAEASDPGISTDLLLRSFFATGASAADLVEVLGRLGHQKPSRRDRWQGSSVRTHRRKNTEA